MPEMPEVQTVVNDLVEAGIIGRTIDSAEVFWAKTLADIDETEFNKRIHNQVILSLDRRGKYIIFTLNSGLFICIHLRMTGRLLLSQKTPEISPYIRLRVHFKDNATLDYFDTRKFGRWNVTTDLSSVVGHIGPEPLEAGFSGPILFEMLGKHKRALKPLLLDQSFLAGLGNIYVDETLWDSCLHPLQPANTVNNAEAIRLYKSICKVLKRGIDSQGTTLGSGKTNYYRLDGTSGRHQTKLMVFRRTGEDCPRCGNTIIRIVIAQRSTHICPHCQKLKHAFLRA